MSRIILTSDLTLNVPLPGDTGDGSYQNPYHIQPAIDDLFANYDLAGFAVTIKLQAGIKGSANPYIFYRGVRLSGRFVGQSGQAVPLLNMPGEPPFVIGAHGPVRIVGSLDPTHPHGAFIYPMPGEGACVSISECSSLSVEGVGMDSSRNRQDCVDVFHGAFLNMKDVVFGLAGADFSNHISLAFGAWAYISGKVMVSGSAASFATIGNNSCLYWNNNGEAGLTLPFEHTAGVNYRDAFLQVDNGIVYAHAVNFIGGAGGRKFLAMRNGIVSTNTGDPNHLPGNQPGYLQTQGQYL